MNVQINVILRLQTIFFNMKFVSETDIDRAIDDLEKFSDEQYEQKMTVFSEMQPVLFAWLFGEQFDLLTEDEQGYLQYLALIAWMANEKVNGPVEAVSEEQIGEAEERNYEILEMSQAQNFRARLDPFFQDTTQEDLLAFAEEAVMEEENQKEPLVTAAGREHIFVALKTLTDVLTRVH